MCWWMQWVSAGSTTATQSCLQSWCGPIISSLCKTCQSVSNVSGISCLRFSTRGVLNVPRTKTSAYGSCSCSVGAKKLELATSIVPWCNPKLGKFHRRLKTSLFCLAYGCDLTANSWLCRLLERHNINVRTELNWQCTEKWLKTVRIAMLGQVQQWRRRVCTHIIIKHGVKCMGIQFYN